MLVVNRFLVDAQRADDFATRAQQALATLSARPGYRSGRLGRALDDPEHWCLITEWESVGAYRRALSAYEVKMYATPLLAESRDEPSAFEILADSGPDGTIIVTPSDRASESHR